jgi:nucleoside-diphosphate-sugar epimerase
VVTGAGGFIGSHLVTALKQRGEWVRGVDLDVPAFGPSDADEFELFDLRQPEQAVQALRGAQDVYALAADMGGMGFISANHATILHNNTLIDLNTFEAARIHGVERYLYSSSACVYPEYLQEDPEVTPLKESDIFPAAPQDAYGWAKIFGELMNRYGGADHGISTRTVRFHNVYGPYGTWTGGREKAPAALCRKVAMAADGEAIEVWGDGLATRSFCYIDDCIEGILRLMDSGFEQPLNLGSDRMVSVDELAQIIIAASGKRDISLKHVPGPQGVRGRNSDNRLLEKVLGWSPEVALERGLAITYAWIAKQVSLSATSREVLVA